MGTAADLVFDMPLSVQSCPGCSRNTYVRLFDSKDNLSNEVFEIVTCQSCGLSYTWQPPMPSQLANYYPAGHQQAKPAAYEIADVGPRVATLCRLAGNKPARILDVGCGKGLVLAELAKLGWTVQGTELDAVSASVALSLGVTVATQALECCRFEPQSFDMITFFHSLEHLPNPILVLRAAQRLLKPNGLLVIEVPNFASPYARMFKGDWFHLDVPRHLSHFDPGSLRHLLSLSGLDVSVCSTTNAMYDAYGALQSLLNWVGCRKNLLNDFNTLQVTWRDLRNGAKPWRDAASLALSLGALATLPLFWIAAQALRAIGKGGTLLMVANRHQQPARLATLPSDLHSA